MTAFILLVFVLIVGLIISAIKLMSKPLSECTPMTLYGLEALKTILSVLGFLILILVITLL